MKFCKIIKKYHSSTPDLNCWPCVFQDPTVIDEQARFYKLLPHDETKRPSHILPTSGSSAAMTATTSMGTVRSSESSLSGVSINGVVGKRMAMVNNKSSSEDSTSKKVWYLEFQLFPFVFYDSRIQTLLSIEFIKHSVVLQVDIIKKNCMIALCTFRSFCCVCFYSKYLLSIDKCYKFNKWKLHYKESWPWYTIRDWSHYKKFLKSTARMRKSHPRIEPPA